MQRETERDRDGETVTERERVEEGDRGIYIIASGRGTQMVHRSALAEAAAGWVLTLMCGL